MGLGLFIVSHIVDLHHFKLEIESEERRGSPFRVIFSKG
jgi:signal transduction histidine kinase